MFNDDFGFDYFHPLCSCRPRFSSWREEGPDAGGNAACDGRVLANRTHDDVTRFVDRIHDAFADFKQLTADVVMGFGDDLLGVYGLLAGNLTGMGKVVRNGLQIASHRLHRRHHPAAVIHQCLGSAR